MFATTTSKIDMGLIKLLMLTLFGIFGLALHGTAASPPPPPTYSVTVGSGSFSPAYIGIGQTATASLTGTLNVQNASSEIQESGDSWSWSASVTGYAPSSTVAFGSVPNGITPPTVSASSGSATGNISATATQSTSPGYYKISVTATDSFTLTDSSTKPPTVTSQSQSGSTALTIIVVTIGSATCTATPDNSYYIGNNGQTSLLAPNGPAVDLGASVGIIPTDAPPSWLSSAYPSAKLGVVQNINNGATYTATYGKPQAVWNSNVTKGTIGYAWTGWSNIITVPACVDTLHDGSAYPMPYDALGPLPSWANSDAPQMPGYTFGTTALVSADGNTVLGSVTYNLTNLSIKAAFSDWCCTVNGTTTFPATAGWSINAAGSPPASGNTPLGIYVTKSGGGGSPITSGEDANQYLGNYDLSNTPVTPPPTRMSFTK